MSDEPKRISAPQYAKAAGLNYGHVRRLAEQGQIPGATKDDRGRWRLPEPSDSSKIIGSDPTVRLAGYGSRSDWTDLSKMTAAQYRVWSRHAPLDQIKSADRVVYYRPGGFDGRKEKFRVVVGPLGRLSVARSADRLLRRYGIGLPT